MIEIRFCEVSDIFGIVLGRDKVGIARKGDLAGYGYIVNLWSERTGALAGTIKSFKCERGVGVNVLGDFPPIAARRRGYSDAEKRCGGEENI